jgi:hypothetical protein
MELRDNKGRMLRWQFYPINKKLWVIMELVHHTTRLDSLNAAGLPEANEWPCPKQCWLQIGLRAMQIRRNSII